MAISCLNWLFEDFSVCYGSSPSVFVVSEVLHGKFCLSLDLVCFLRTCYNVIFLVFLLLCKLHDHCKWFLIFPALRYKSEVAALANVSWKFFSVSTFLIHFFCCINAFYCLLIVVGFVMLLNCTLWHGSKIRIGWIWSGMCCSQISEIEFLRVFWYFARGYLSCGLLYV